MTKFEQIGINNLYKAKDKETLNRNFSWSCDLCCNRGMRIECDRCGIAYTHSLLISIK